MYIYNNMAMIRHVIIVTTDKDYTQRLVLPYGFAYYAGIKAITHSINLFFTDIKPAWPRNYIIYVLAKSKKQVTENIDFFHL